MVTATQLRPGSGKTGGQMPGISMAGCVLLLATTLSAQYLERVIPVSDPPAGGAVSMPACRIYNSATNRVYAVGDWLAVVDCSLNAIVSEFPIPYLCDLVASGRQKFYFGSTYRGAGVAVMSALNDSLICTVPIRGRQVGGIAYNDSNDCLVATEPDSSSVLLIDGHTSTPRARLSVTGSPGLVTWNSRDNRYNIILSNGNLVWMRVYDADSLIPLADVGCEQAQVMTYVPSVNKVYVGCPQVGRPSSVYVVDGTLNRVLRRFEFGARVFCWNPVGNKLYCIGDSIRVLDCVQDSLLKTLPGQGQFVALDSVNNRLFLGSGDSIRVIDCSADTGFVVAGGGRGVVWASQQGRVYAGAGDDRILVYDARTVRPLDTINAALRLSTQLWNPALNRLYVQTSDPGSGTMFIRSLTVIDGSTGAIVAQYPVSDSGGEMSLGLGPTGAKLYFGAWDDTELVVVDCIANRVTSRIPVRFPWGLAANAVDNKVYCCDQTGAFLVIDPVGDSIVKNLGPLLGAPTVVSWHPSVGKVFVQDYSGSLTVISGATDSVIATIPCPGAARLPPVCNTTNNKLYLCGNNGFSVVDADRNLLLKTFHELTMCVACTWNPMTDKVYFSGMMVRADSLLFCIGVVDGATDSLLAILRVPRPDPFYYSSAELMLAHPSRPRAYAYLRPGAIAVIDCNLDSIVAVVSAPVNDDISDNQYVYCNVDPETDRVYFNGACHVYVVQDREGGVSGPAVRSRSPRIALQCRPSIGKGGFLLEVQFPGFSRPRLNVTDCVGRTVRTFAGSLSQSAVWRWDGTDSQGRELPDGVYFLVLEASGLTARSKVVLLR